MQFYGAYMESGEAPLLVNEVRPWQFSCTLRNFNPAGRACKLCPSRHAWSRPLVRDAVPGDAVPALCCVLWAAAQCNVPCGSCRPAAIHASGIFWLAKSLEDMCHSCTCIAVTNYI